LLWNPTGLAYSDDPALFKASKFIVKSGDYEMDRQEPNVELRELASRTLERCKGDVQAATTELTNTIGSHPILYKTLMDPLLREACYNLIRGVCRANRRAIWHTPQPSVSTAKQNVGVLAKATRTSLLYYPLHGGLFLKDAFKADVLNTVHYNETQGKDMLVKARWLTLVAERLPDNKKVGEVLTEKQLAALKTKVDKGA